MAERQIQVEVGWYFDRVYVHHSKVEVEDAPALFEMTWKPHADMNIRASAKEIGGRKFEVTLMLTMSCKNHDTPAVKLEIEQAALIRVKPDLDEDEIKRVLSVEVPNALFPYLRESADNAFVRASLPPMILAHVHFEKVFEEGLKQIILQEQRQTKSTKSQTDEILN